MTRTIWDALGGQVDDLDRLGFRGAGSLQSAFAVTDFAAASVAAAALAVDELVAHVHPHAVRSLPDEGTSSPVQTRQPVAVEVDRRLASLWFATSLRPHGWQVPPLRDPLTGDYPTRDGWIRLHANAAHHRAAVHRTLGAVADRNAAAAAVAGWEGADLEQTIIDAGGCAAQMRDADAWRVHPQGSAVAAEPLVACEQGPAGATPGWLVARERPLHGVRVLDVTRVLAGPVATRFLAGLGATVLRIDPPDWDEPGAVPDVTLGKRCARLDLKTPSGHATFAGLLADADVLVHGLRPCALDRLGFDAGTRERLAPGLVDVSLDAYGWSGSWAMRRGFDSLVQMSSGIADAGMRWRASASPVPPPVQALDHATGYLMAAATLRGLRRRLKHGVATRARLSLARTARLLVDFDDPWDDTPLAPESADDTRGLIESTPWGPARRIAAPWRIAGVDVHWDLPASALGSVSPCWR
ncbi:CoA transferase [Paraburkholderia phymatum]|uniref:CoA transferase n=1 Tax=Paraburkholderia phymatum TaxID=148447 RepID=A0ACC6U4L6_9BURK